MFFHNFFFFILIKSNKQVDTTDLFNKWVGLRLRNLDPFNKHVGLVLTFVVAYSWLDTTRTRHANTNCYTHLLHNRSSLFYKVFKAPFFPNCSIMETIDSRVGSYAWRSILKGKDVIQRGARRRVGDGNKVLKPGPDRTVRPEKL